MTAPITPKTITLSDPVKWDGQTITEVVIKKPKLKDVRKLQAALAGVEDRLDQGAIMVSQLTGIPAAAFEDVDFDDFTEISEACGAFFPQGAALPSGELS